MERYVESFPLALLGKSSAVIDHSHVSCDDLFQCMRIKPPMCVTMDDADFAVSVLRRAIHDHMNGNGKC